MNCGGPAPWAHCCCWYSSSRQPQHHYATSSAPQQKTTCTINQSMSIVTGVFPSLGISIKCIAQHYLCSNNKQPTQSSNQWLLLSALFQLWWASTSLHSILERKNKQPTQAIIQWLIVYTIVPVPVSEHYVTFLEKQQQNNLRTQ